MAFTLSQVRSSVRAHIDEPLANYWSDSELNDYIGKRQLDLWRRIYQLKKDYWLSPTPGTISLVIGTTRYTLPSDCFRVTAIRTTSSGRQDVSWIPSDPNSDQFVSGLRTDIPITYPFSILYAIRSNNTIDVSPVPQEALTASVEYIRLPTQVSADSDTFIIPDPFLDYVEYAATADALQKGPVGDSVGWQQKAEDAWKNILLALDTPRTDQGPDIVRGCFDDGTF